MNSVEDKNKREDIAKNPDKLASILWPEKNNQKSSDKKPETIRLGGGMRCFVCNKEFLDLKKCPDCGNKLIPQR